jgi:hypothetical protein
MYKALCGFLCEIVNEHDGWQWGVQEDPFGSNDVRLMLSGYENVSMTDNTPLRVERTSPDEVWTTFCDLYNQLLK